MKNNQKHKIEDYIGARFSMLTVTGEMYTQTSSGKHARKFKCMCDCGNEHLAFVGMLISGRQKSCGCWKKEKDNQPKSHGMSKSSPYNVWCGIVSRCTSINDDRWEDYGGRGITVCSEWRESFDNFWNDVKDTYQEGLTFDRIDVNGNYNKENCRWTTVSVQNHNKRKLPNCTSKYIGVNFDKRVNKWISRICVSKNNRKTLGTFSSEYQAALAYDNASEVIYGDRPNKTNKE